jgi:hypothetical protein
VTSGVGSGVAVASGAGESVTDSVGVCSSDGTGVSGSADAVAAGEGVTSEAVEAWGAAVGSSKFSQPAKGKSSATVKSKAMAAALFSFLICFPGW